MTYSSMTLSSNILPQSQLRYVEIELELFQRSNWQWLGETVRNLIT
jgi:hypothetical protein